MGSGVSKKEAYVNQIHGAASSEQKARMNSRVHHTSAFLGSAERATNFNAGNAFVHPHEEILNGNHTKEFKDGSTYTGEFVQGHRHGKGKQTWPDGSSYEGEWQNDRKHGLNATWIFKSGNTFKGELCEGHLAGLNSQMSYANGDSYVGSFGFSGREGQGHMKYADGTEYDGNWNMDRPHGKGSYDWSRCKGAHLYPNYLKFDGDIFSGQLEGIGKIHFVNGDVYHGQVHADHTTGIGHMKYADGTEYDGNWYMDCRQGTGTQTYRDGTTWKGEFHHDKRNGFGALYDSSGGKISEGVWKEDEGPI